MIVPKGSSKSSVEFNLRVDFFALTRLAFATLREALEDFFLLTFLDALFSSLAFLAFEFLAEFLDFDFFKLGFFFALDMYLKC